MRDGQILVHLDRKAPMSVTALARHLGLAASTLSEAITNLAALGYVEKTAGASKDRRAVGLSLTDKGVEAVRDSSVLEAPRLAAVLRRLAPADRRRVIESLSVLADACRRRP